MFCETPICQLFFLLCVCVCFFFTGVPSFVAVSPIERTVATRNRVQDSFFQVYIPAYRAVFFCSSVYITCEAPLRDRGLLHIPGVSRAEKGQHSRRVVPRIDY